MALNASGQISMGGATAGESINLELGFSATAQIGLNDNAVRTLAGIASGAIDLNTFKGKSNNPPFWFNTLAAGDQNGIIGISRVNTSGGSSVVAGGGTNVGPISLYKFNNSTGATTYSYFYYLPGSVNHNYVVSATDTSGNTYVVTSQNGQTTNFVTKFDSSGSPIWSTSFNLSSSNSYAHNNYACITDSSSNLYVTGYTFDGSGIYYIFIYKLNSSGTTQWVRFIGPGNGGYSYPHRVYDGEIALASNGNILFPSLINGPNANFLLEYNPSGTQIAARSITWNSLGNDNIQSCSVDSSGNIFVAGTGVFSGGDRFAVAKLDSSFNVIWAKRITNSLMTTDAAACVSADGAGGCVLSGGSFASITTIMRLDSSGDLLWTRSLMNPGNIANYTQANAFAYMRVSGNSILFKNFMAATNGSGDSAGYSGYVASLPLDGSGLGAYLVRNQYCYYSAATASVTTITASFTSSSTKTDFGGSFSNTNSQTVPSMTASGNSFYSVSGTVTSNTYGSYSYTIPGTYSWICPTAVTSVSAVVIGAGGGGSSGAPGAKGSGGGGGGLAYRNNISVTPAASYEVVVGASPGGSSPSPGGGGWWQNGGSGGGSTFNNTAPSRVAATGGQGGSCGYYTAGGFGQYGDGTFSGGGSGRDLGGGGAGGYSGGGAGNGPSGYTPTGGGGGGNSIYYSKGGGVGLAGQSNTSGFGFTGAHASGSPGYSPAGSFGHRCFFGGGGGAGSSSFVQYTPEDGDWSISGGQGGGRGGVRIVYPGSSRSFPNTNVGVQ